MLRNFGTVRPIFTKIASKVAQDSKEKSSESAVRKKKIPRNYRAKRRGVGFHPPSLIRVKTPQWFGNVSYYVYLSIVKRTLLMQRAISLTRALTVIWWHQLLIVCKFVAYFKPKEIIPDYDYVKAVSVCYMANCMNLWKYFICKIWDFKFLTHGQ